MPAAPVLWPAGVLAGSCVCCGTRACRRPEAPAGHQPGRHRACLWRCSRQGEFSGRRGSTPRLPAAASKQATIWAPRRRRGRGHRAGMPPSLDLARSAPCPHDPTRPSDAAARSDSAVYLSAGSQIVAPAPAGRASHLSGITAELLSGNAAVSGS